MCQSRCWFQKESHLLYAYKLSLSHINAVRRSGYTKKPVQMHLFDLIMSVIRACTIRNTRHTCVTSVYSTRIIAFIVSLPVIYHGVLRECRKILTDS